MTMEVGIYVRTKEFGIQKITWLDHDEPIMSNGWTAIDNVIKGSHNIIDLIEYMDLLEIENPVKLYDKNIEVSLFNPVRCDGFTTFEDGTNYIILNLDYLVDVKDLKIKSIVTHEQFNAMKYEVE